jgi:hypothetical protein
MMGQQDYVVGLEPGTNGSEGRAEARQSGRLIILHPCWPAARKSKHCWPELQVDRQEGNRCPTDTAEKFFA